MKLLRGGKQKFQFAIKSEEKELLFHVLQLYPLVPAAHHRLSRGLQIPDSKENQELLEESLLAQRQENRRQVEALLKEPERFSETQAGWRVSFSRAEIEWLLQVLNDVRIGSWLALGSPAGQVKIQPGMSKPTARHVLVMDVAAFFEMCLLQAVSGTPPVRHD